MNLAKSPLICSLILLFMLGAEAQLDRIKVDATTHWFYDTDGRVVIFHGINSVRKEFPWYHEHLFDDIRMDDLRRFGLNVVRLGTMWAGAEPTEGVFNETYIDILGQAIQRLSDRGIYVVLDMHQDVLSSYYEAYDGVPTWLIDYFPPPTNPYPWPLEEIEFWEQGYLTQAASEGFQFIYNNTENAVYKWANFWVKMAETFKDNPTVLGYEYMNEPWIGDYFQDGSLRLPGVAGRNNLMPVYDIITEEVRKVDPDNGIIFYEPVIYGQFLSGNYTGSGFDRVPGSSEYSNSSVFSWHAYCWALEFVESNATDSEREDARDFCIEELIPKFFESAHENMNKTGGGGLLTEFGLCIGYDRPDEIDMPCEAFVNIADEFLHGWIEWDYNDGAWYDGEGNRQWGKILSYVRTYARRIAGIPQYMNFNTETFEFVLEYTANLEITAPTEVFVPIERYENGFEVRVAEGFEYNVENDLVYVFPSTENTDQEMGEVIITAL